MMREVVGLIGGIILALYTLFFLVPMLSFTKAGESSLFNSTDPTISMSYTLGTGMYNVIWFIPLLVGAFLIISFALRRDIYE